jgi:predicted RNA-binding protein with RPS1 domain
MGMREDEWRDVKQQLSVGSMIEGRVIRHEAYGLFVDIGFECEGLIQIIDIKDDGAVTADDYPSVGAPIVARVLGFKEKGHQVWLGIKPSQTCSGRREDAVELRGEQAGVTSVVAAGFDRFRMKIKGEDLELPAFFATFLERLAHEAPVQFRSSRWTWIFEIQHVDELAWVTAPAGRSLLRFATSTDGAGLLVVPETPDLQICQEEMGDIHSLDMSVADLVCAEWQSL